MDHQTDTQYCVVKNAEQQFSIWPLDKRVPPGWEDTGFHGSKQSCLDQVEIVWVDMRPKSLVDTMQSQLGTSN